MKRFGTLVSLLMSSLLLHVHTLQAAGDSIQITNASVTCGSQNGNLGAAFDVTANYTANDQRIIDEIIVIGDGGGRIDVYHYVDGGTGSVSDSGNFYGGSWNGSTYGPPDYPYTVELVMELYAATSIDYINGGDVINGPLVSRSIMVFMCIQEGQAVVIISEDEPGKPFDPGDGRIKPDPAAPVAVYCRDYGIDVYRINADSTGSLVFTTTNAEIEAVGETPAENTLLEAYDTIRLYRLMTGEFQLNAGPDAEGKEYILIWDGC